MDAEKVVRMEDFKPARLQLVCSNCGKSGEMQCNCEVGFVREANRTRKGDQVTEALRDPANARKSDRALANELGVGPMTVGRARKATAPNGTVAEKRVGKDGKARKAPKTNAAREQARRKLNSGEPVTKIARDAGMSRATMRAAYAVEQARDDALNELQVDPETLSTTAKQKLEVARRTMERKFTAEHAARMKQIDEEVRQRVLTEGKEYRDRMNQMWNEHCEREEHFRQMIDNHKAIFILAEFMTILKCLHPDNSASQETRADAFRLFNSKKLQLTKER